MMSGTLGGGNAFNSLDDVSLDEVDDDIEIVIEDEPATSDVSAAPLRGQNEDASDDDSEPDYSNPRFQERIAQEVRQRDEVEARALAEQERTEFALLRAEQKNIETQRDSFKLALDGVDIRIRTTTEALKFAKQDDNTSAEVDLEMQLSELRRIRDSIEENMGRLPDAQALEGQFRQHIEQRRAQFQKTRAGRTQSEAPRALNEKAAQWTRVNSWMADPSRKTEQSVLLEVNNALAAEGYDPNSEDFFTELSRRMAKRFPGLNVRTTSGAGVGQAPGRPAQAPGRSAPPVAPARSVAPPGQAAKSKTRVGLDSNDVKLMRMFRIDPNDKAAVQRYALEKHKRMQSENRR